MNKIKILVISFLTVLLSVISSCGRVIKDQDGNIYQAISIGGQKWLAKNLSVSHFRNGDLIPEVKSAEEWKKAGEEGEPAWCYETSSPENGAKYGRLYNWYAVTDPRGLAPKGWHIPSDQEWSALTDFLGGDVLAAYKMRTVGVSKSVGEKEGSGFCGLPGGHRNNTGIFYGAGSFGYWWSSTEMNDKYAWIRLLDYLKCSVSSLDFSKIYGCSVRCVKD